MIRSILMTTDTVGGVWSYSLELAAALGVQGIEVHLATMGPRPNVAQRARASELPNLMLHDSDYKLEWMPDPWEDVEASGSWLLRLEQSLCPDLVHLNGYCHAALNWRSPVLVVCHSCVLSWWQAVKGEEAPPEWRRYGFEVARGLRAASAIVAPTAAFLKEIKRCYGPLAQSRVIPNGIDPGRFAPEPKQPVILTAGRLWDEAKNTGALAEVAPSLPWPVRVAGSGGEALPNVEQLGGLSAEEMADQMAEASIYALPARYEPFGLSVLEAALSECALVLSDIPTLRENWNGAALFVPSDDRAQLRQALLSLIDDPGLRLSLGRRARRQARKFTSERMAASYFELYNELVGSLAVKEASA